jgi:hypothetical protein
MIFTKDRRRVMFLLHKRKSLCWLLGLSMLEDRARDRKRKLHETEQVADLSVILGVLQITRCPSVLS